MTTTTPTYYGFQSANRGEQPAWFHTPEAALNFAHACGFTTGEDQRPLTLDDIETTTEANPEDIADETGFGSPTKPTHTPGPWAASGGFNNGHGLHVHTLHAKGFPFADIHQHFQRVHNTPEIEANARLIAASPDLLSAAKAALAYLEASRPKGDIRKIFSELNAHENDAVKPLRAAIAKAEGRS